MIWASLVNDFNILGPFSAKVLHSNGTGLNDVWNAAFQCNVVNEAMWKPITEPCFRSEKLQCPPTCNGNHDSRGITFYVHRVVPGREFANRYLFVTPNRTLLSLFTSFPLKHAFPWNCWSLASRAIIGDIGRYITPGQSGTTNSNSWASTIPHDQFA